MAHAENDTIINRPPNNVYEFLADGLNNPKWRSGVISISLRSGAPGEVGAEYAQILTGPGGRQIAGDYRITTATPGKELSFAVIAGPARPTGNYYLEPAGTGTKVTFILDFAPKGLARLMGPMIAKTMQREVAQLATLKRVLES